MERLAMIFAVLALVFIIIFCVYSFIITNNEPEPIEQIIYDRIPMVYVNNNLYYERGEVVHSIPHGWKYYGSITKQVSQSGPMIKKELYSNTVEIGSRVFLNKKYLLKIYVEVKLNDEIIYLEYKNQ